jgi:hypothetical protein
VGVEWTAAAWEVPVRCNGITMNIIIAARMYVRCWNCSLFGEYLSHICSIIQIRGKIDVGEDAAFRNALRHSVVCAVGCSDVVFEIDTLRYP